MTAGVFSAVVLLVLLSAVIVIGVTISQEIEQIRQSLELIRKRGK